MKSHANTFYKKKKNAWEFESVINQRRRLYELILISEITVSVCIHEELGSGLFPNREVQGCIYNMACC
jgi:hypothetical protein